MTDYTLPVDTRTRAQKIGEPDADDDEAPIKKIKANGKTLAMEKAAKLYKSNARHIFAEHAETLALSIIGIALDPHEKTKDRLDAHRIALQFALGRPSTVHVNEDGKPATPIFNIKIGDNSNPAITSIEMPTIEVEDPALDDADGQDD